MKPVYSLILLLFALFCHAQTGRLDSSLSSKGLVNAATMDTTIHVCLKYATTDNFMGEAVYTDVAGIWLHVDAARKLVRAQRLLKERYPAYSLIVYDAARPMSVQRKMWRLVKGTDKTNYVSNPAHGGGLHNYGMAVDVGIVDQSGRPLPMGTPFDYFGEEAHTTAEEGLVQSGKITREAFNNRRLLRQVMKQAGFSTIAYEWWHFNACTRQEAKAGYRLID
ncbi:MAG: M15 family metallopeptidase [Tannerellaceae bacterium]|jgi:D-alanyl-D-alanine dipeptidase|nr:M15 family metallopeptidase [Tannerellaceae bacterium]